MPFKNPHPLYSVWQGMLGRCRNPNYAQWADYGGRGITVCDRWQTSFQAFVDDMGPRPDDYTLDRRDNDGPYSPENCRWTTRAEQQLNQRRAVYVTVDGTPYRAIELARLAGVKTDTIIIRARQGLPYADVIGRKKRSPFTQRIPRIRKTHCPQGHEYTEANSIVINAAKRTRACRICHNERARLKYAAHSSKYEA